jgi:hypothetical protein
MASQRLSDETSLTDQTDAGESAPQRAVNRSGCHHVVVDALGAHLVRAQESQRVAGLSQLRLVTAAQAARAVFELGGYLGAAGGR